ncbi:hypothetical protein VB712_16360 [Spirulina sp. CCNP1310]|uniref:hypothetical protein n=1 Tax=Spirulina sp. CCNP1310 TaxID=3110249 RepID=UPI002B1F001B|nr:hypothetical protein [Spirulina sp. CCNP1310]MEA5420807.1 hypothetical protein [Spirulina sp. CCNP1310]
MSEADFHNNAPTPETATEVSAETKALVEDNMPQESDEIKHHVMALIEAIKKQSQSQIETAGDMTREVYVNAMRQAQETLKNTGLLLDNQRETLDSSISSLEDTATQKWEAIVSDMQKFGDRLDRAVNTAWQILTEPETKPTTSEPTTIDITEDSDDPTP